MNWSQACPDPKRVRQIPILARAGIASVPGGATNRMARPASRIAILRQQIVECCDDLIGIALNAGHALGEKAAV